MKSVNYRLLLSLYTRILFNIKEFYGYYTSKRLIFFYKFENEFRPLLSTLFEHRRSINNEIRDTGITPKESIKGVRQFIFSRAH